MTNHNHKIIHHLPPPTTTRSNSTIQACAACRYQRRKCAPDCILAPYFPHDRQRQFQNAHKLFGVSNITKIIRHLDQPQKDEAMRTIIYQSDVRAQDPVGGCYRIIRELHRQIEISRAELEIVLQQLATCRTLAMQNQNQNQNHLNFNHDQIIIDDVGCDIHIINNPDDPHLYDDPPVDHHHHGRHTLDLDVSSQQHKYHDQYVWGKQDWSDQPVGGGWQVAHMVVPLQPWATVHDSGASCLDVKPQPLQTLDACVCDDFKSLLLNEIPAVDKKVGLKETNEEAREEENHVALIKKEINAVSYQDEDEDDKDRRRAA